MGQPFSGESPWRRSRVVVTIPAAVAGADWALVVPAGHLFVLHSLWAILTTSAAVANRAVRLAFGNGDVTYLEVPATVNQAASLGFRYSWLDTSPAAVLAPGVLSNLPRLTLEAGWTVAPITAAIDVADQWSSMFALVTDVTVRPGANDVGEAPDLTVEVYSATGY